MITEEPFGTVDGRPARAFIIDGGSGMLIKVSDYGARLVEAHVPDATGRTADVVLGFDSASDYAQSTAYFGATIGRYANRIRRGRFVHGGAEIQVDCNEGEHHLHGGAEGWDRRIWRAEPHADGLGVTFRTSSPDGDMGFPGACEVRSTYELDGRDLRLTMEAVPDQDTVINMTHHSYVNLAGHASGDILGQRLRIAADHYIPVEGDLLPTGELLPVAGTPFDFRELATIGERMEALFGGSGGKGFDHNWCVRRTASGPGLVEVLEAVDPVSRRRMRAWTSEPGLQVYMGGYLGSAVIGKGGSPYCAFAGFTLEGQKFPDSPNQPQFPSPVVRAGDVYRQDMVLEFDTV